MISKTNLRQMFYFEKEFDLSNYKMIGCISQASPTASTSLSICLCVAVSSLLHKGSSVQSVYDYQEMLTGEQQHIQTKQIFSVCQMGREIIMLRTDADHCVYHQDNSTRRKFIILPHRSYDTEPNNKALWVKGIEGNTIQTPPFSQEKQRGGEAFFSLLLSFFTSA